MNEELMTPQESVEHCMIESLSNAGSAEMYSSMSTESFEDKTALYNAMNNPDHRLADYINKTIDVKDVFVEMVEMVNNATGELSKNPRIVLIDANGESYACVSFGVFSALRKLFSIFGMPTWEDPLPLIVTQISKGNDRRILSLSLAK